MTETTPAPAPTTSLTVYHAWQSTLAPFLLPAAVLSAWPVFMVIAASNRTPLKLLCMVALVSLADGLLGSAAFPLAHQYAFTTTQNDCLFYAGSICYWLSGLVCGPVLEQWAMRRACVVLSAAGLLGALCSLQSVFFFALIGRCLSATATSCLSTVVEYVLYDEAHLRRGAGQAERDDVAAEKEHATPEVSEGQGGGMLTIFHQLRPLTLWAAMWLGQRAMSFTATVSTGPCWVAAMCYAAVMAVAWLLLPVTTLDEATRLAARRRGAGRSGQRATGSSSSSGEGEKLLGYVTASYGASLRTLLSLRGLTRHLVDILFGGLFFVVSLLWVPTLEMYDDSVPFGFLFQIFMIANFLGSTFALPTWAIGWAEAALVALLSVTARLLNTSRDYAIPVTIMVAGVAMHLVAGVHQTTGSLTRAGYASADTPLTFLFLLKALTGVSGWLFLNAIDGMYMENVFVFMARWVYALMWIEAIALAQHIARRAAQHRESMGWQSGQRSSSIGSGVTRIVSVRSKEDSAFEDGGGSPYEVAAAVGTELDAAVDHRQHGHSHGSSNGLDNRFFRP